jgi:hypothetical protein
MTTKLKSDNIARLEIASRTARKLDAAIVGRRALLSNDALAEELAALSAPAKPKGESFGAELRRELRIVGRTRS